MLPHRDRTIGVGLSLAALVIVFAASRPERRRLLDALTTAGATSPDTAMTAYQLAADQSRTLQRLVRQRLVVATAEGRFYLGDADLIATANRVTAAMVTGAIVFVVAGIIGLAMLGSR